MALAFTFVKLITYQHEGTEPPFNRSIGGTGFLFRWKSGIYFTTAKHVWLKEEGPPRKFHVVVSRGGKWFSLGLHRHANLSQINNLNTAACDVTIWEVFHTSYQFIEREKIPDIEEDLNEVMEKERVALGYPLEEPFSHIDYEAKRLFPHIGIIKGWHKEGGRDLDHLSSMSLDSKWIEAESGISFPVSLPSGINGMCGGPVIGFDRFGNQRLAGMIVMAGHDLIRYIQLPVIFHLLAHWQSDLSKKALES